MPSKSIFCISEFSQCLKLAKFILTIQFDETDISLNVCFLTFLREKKNIMSIYKILCYTV